MYQVAGLEKRETCGVPSIYSLASFRDEEAKGLCCLQLQKAWDHHEDKQHCCGHSHRTIFLLPD